MYIDDAERVKIGSRGVLAESPAAFDEIADMNFFNAQLDHSAELFKSTPPVIPVSLFNLSASESSFKRVKKGMDDTLRNKQTKESYALPQSLALANFEVVSRVKVLGMLVKGVDKISNLA
ncbi:hypothetical protein BLL37_26235 [Pseudomonas azotoformans]|uniref:Uncharacterized protein n=1 Tax=Pseudomonas azotoformans TaxID=47878 RepID=A0A1V2J895_PSEAZ|nr:hypothetical protein [Pseudomonas azotoformans]OIN48842.1 hypothetical protein BFL39_13165 [Pseudomonas azotoformans]ONH41653.1 hypothetical protein BLL37_26235 [Pseudomonas azotoformans]SDO66383.1 hypothetical protein SAMN04489799_5192 [Pseudomonas azotoformans]